MFKLESCFVCTVYIVQTNATINKHNPVWHKTERT